MTPMQDTLTDPPVSRWRIGDVHFDSETGDVTRPDGNDEPATTRLGPKPSQLLCMLIQHNGELLAIETIRQALWPDVQVEFDQGMHFCMRQVRAALGDTASNPTFIETLPRRGYRLILPAQPMDGNVANPNAEQSNRWRITAMIALPVFGIAALLIVLSIMRVAEPVRLAIMPFNAPADSEMHAMSDVATLLLAELGNDDTLAVIGPSTTVQYADETALIDAAAGLQLQYIINARFLNNDNADRMLAEFIRTSDGAHIWVETYDRQSNSDAVAAEIAANVRRCLEEQASQ